MKSWGTRILILYVGFVVLIATMVYLSMKQNTDLVAKDYYAQELAYQKKLDKINRTKKLSQPVSWKLENGKLNIQFPEEVNTPVKGSVSLYCPSDATKDMSKSFYAAGYSAEVEFSNAKKGQYLLQLDWQSGDQTFYTEETITIP